MKIKLKGLQGVVCKTFLPKWLAMAVLFGLPACAMADVDVATLSNGGSTATIDLDNGGMNNWTVNNQNQLNQQWFWYSVNGGAANPINQIGGLTWNQPTSAELLATYTDPGVISVTIQYILAGAGMGTGNADITENIAIDNLSGSAFNNLNFYQYSNFNLLQENNSLSIFPDYDSHGNIIGYDEAQQTVGATSLAEGIIAPDATDAEAGLAGSVYSDVSTGKTLNNVLNAGPGNVAWGFEWSTSLASGGEFDIEKDKSLSVQGVPEPSTIALITLGLGALGLARRRQSS